MANVYFLFAIDPFLLSFFIFFILNNIQNVRKVPRIVSKIPFHKKKNNAICAQSLNFTVDLFFIFFFLFDYLKE